MRFIDENHAIYLLTYACRNEIINSQFVSDTYGVIFKCFLWTFDFVRVVENIAINNSTFILELFQIHFFFY